MEDENLADFEGASCDWYDVPCHLSSFADWLADALLFIPRKLFEQIMAACGAAIELIPVPSWAENVANLFAAIPPGVAYFAAFMELPTGIGIVLSAYGIRFLIRRLPVIG